MGVQMNQIEIRDLAFWITIHQAAYTEGIKLANEFLIAVDRKSGKMNDFKRADSSLNHFVELLCEKGIDPDKLGTLFENEEEDVKPALLKEAEIDVNMPEADSY